MIHPAAGPLQALALALLAGCGGATATSAPAAVDHEIVRTGEIRVYAWDGARLVGLYCHERGALRTDDCHFDHPEHDDAVLIIETDTGRSIWTGRATSPTLGIDESGVAQLELPELWGNGRQYPPRPGELDASKPLYHVDGFTPIGIAAIDLDHDGVAEVIFLSDDIGGVEFVVAEELGIDDGFSVTAGADELDL